MRLRVIVNHGLLSCAEPLSLPHKSKCWETRQRSQSGARSFSEGRLRPLGRSHCAWLTCWCSVAGEHCEGSDTSAVTFSNRLEDGLQDSLFGSTEHAEVKDSRQVDRLLSHDRLSKNNST